VTTYKHIVVVHGIGNQKPAETALQFMNEFCRALPSGGSYKLKINNLVPPLDWMVRHLPSEPSYIEFTDTKTDERHIIGFSEVYWQELTHDYLKNHDGVPPIPIFTWAHSINTRLIGHGHNYSQWRDAISNLESILRLSAKLALLARGDETFYSIINQFLGDVQMYGESDVLREQINDIFDRVLADVGRLAGLACRNAGELDVAQAPPEIYIVAHSLGTVVSWNSLQLAALNQSPPDWLRHVKALVTMGSPIDKYHLFWPFRFPKEGAGRNPKILWYNFWDHSDPVGYSLDGVFGGDSAENHQFRREFDSGYSRYPVPGLAHLGYWTDRQMHRKIIQDVMRLHQFTKGREAVLLPSLWWGMGKEIAGRVISVQWAGDYVAWALARTVEFAALIYFLSPFVALARLNMVVPQPVLDLVGKFPFGADNSFANSAAWVLLPSGFWAALRSRLIHKRDRRPVRLDRVLSVLWWVVVFPIIVVVAGQGGGSQEPEAKNYLGWAIGLLATALVWALHTRVHRGLVEMWRYTQGATQFKPSQKVDSSDKALPTYSGR
jgi:hypothetical protein